jgi:hypothetical protein
MESSIDREKVIKGLEFCQGACGTCCPYWNGSMTDGSCMVKLHADALALLKEQEKEIESLNVALENVSQMGHY